MRIGIDIDGVLTDLAKFVADYGTKFCYENSIEFAIKTDEYDEAKALGISSKDAEKFWNKYLPYYVEKYNPREFANVVIAKLKEKHEIYIVTARNEYGLPPKYYGLMQEMVLKWLKSNNIVYDKIIFTKESKLSYCIENGIDVLIDDSPSNILDVSTKIPVLCFDNPYNKNIAGKNITRVYSWYDILDKLEKIKNDKE